jgi:hypothetical protein
MLLLNLIGIIGFGLLVIYSFYEKEIVYKIDADDTFFWLGILELYYVGFALALIELIVFEISNVVFKLHCFFIELYKNIQLEEAHREEDFTSSFDDQEESDHLQLKQ